MDLLILTPLAAIIALIAAFILARGVLSAPSGDETMNSIADAIREGANAYMNRQYTTITYVAISIVVVFVVLLLWGFVSGNELKEDILKATWLKWVVVVVAVVAVVLALFWAAGIELTLFDFLFHQSWSNVFWTNFVFIVVVVVALAIMWKSSGGK